MPAPRHDLRPAPPADKYGLPGFSYPTNDKTAYAVVVEDVPIASANYSPLAAYTLHPGTGGSTGIAAAILTLETPAKGDGTRRNVRRVYETLPGPPEPTSRIDPEDGAVINEIRRAVRTDTILPASAAGSVVTRYEPRGDSPLVSYQYTTTIDMSGVVRRFPMRVNLRLPRTLAGIAVTFNVNKGVGDDTGNGSGVSAGTDFSLRSHASARASSSLGIIPEVYLPIRDNADQGESFPAEAMQVYLKDAITETALLAKLTAAYEVVVTGTLTPAAGGTYPGNNSNINGVIWFSKASTARKLSWTNGVWSLGTDAEVQAGNYWKRTAAATAWLGSYAPQGTASGTATVAVGRTVLPMPRWGTQEVNLITAGKQVSVSSNASASEEVTVASGTETAHSISLGHGYSVSVGGSQGRVRVEPTLHGQIVIAKSTYSDSVNATATAALAALAPLTSTGTSSGFGGDSHAQTVLSYVRVSAAATSFTPSAKTISSNTLANPTVVTTTTAHGLGTGDVAVIAGSNSTPSINGSRAITYISATTFSVAVNVSVAGTAGTVQGPAVSTATTIPATDPPDVPYSGPYLVLPYESSSKDALYTQFHVVVADMDLFASAPSSIFYSDPAAIYAQGSTITPNHPAFLGGPPASYAISPSIPAGLAFNTTTGIITGAPTAGQVATAYTITGTNPSGSASTTITIAVAV